MSLALTWTEQEPPRPPAAVLGTGGAAASLALAARRRLADGADLELAASADHLLVLGAGEDLPWVDHGTWLGVADGVLLPTTASPSVPPDLLRRALGARAGTRRLVIVPGRVLLFTAGAAPDPEWLLAYAQRTVA